tara:strand:+ start:3800 stop:4471 length:672 start_codon:yes stop_codon:yes gene_type:complete
MIISHRKKFIWIHLPKCAGTSIRKLLQTNPIFQTDIHPMWHTKKDINWKEEYPKVDTNLWTHSSASDIKKYLDERGYRWDDYFKFVFIRNPWEREVSAYEYHRQVMSKNKYPKDFNIKNIEMALNQPPKNFIMRSNRWSPHNYIFDKDGKLMVDFVGKVENIEQDFKKIVKKILPDAHITQWRLPHMNATTKNKSYRDYYDDESIEYIRNRDAKIIELGNYSF